MVSTFLPRVARERRASLLSLLLLEERARALEEARDAAVKTASAKDAFHANLSHEIRTPLNGLTGVVDRLKRTPLSADQQEALEQLDRCGQSLLLILNDALDAVSMEAGQLTLRAEPFQLDALLTDAVGLFEAQATSKGLTLQLQRRALHHHVVGDAQRIRQVLQNLIGNAVKFTERGAIVVSADVVAVDAARVELVVAVTDTGPGFDEADTARLFTRFGQLEQGRRRGGTGLGLAIARELTTLMGGTLQAASPGRGRGATFTLRVPLPLAEPARHSVRGRRVLVVDDNPLNVAVARAYLEVLGCVVDRASGGAEAVQLASSKAYDAILMDCLMPGIGGNEAAAQLRALHVTTPIVACTASDDADTERSARAAGMQGIVHKPVSSETLLQALLRVLDPTPPAAAVEDADAPAHRAPAAAAPPSSIGA
jgi:CheY-like chemotaxis protein/nitrogen-specific signal transduction histidine kinase